MAANDLKTKAEICNEIWPTQFRKFIGRRRIPIKVIFLDIDGVLNSERYWDYLTDQKLKQIDKYGTLFDPLCVAQLARIIEATGADIVISSDWKQFLSYRDFLTMWKDRALPGFVTDTTPSIDPHRGNEIAAWLDDSYDVWSFVIIDDLPEYEFNSDQLPMFVQTDPRVGLDEKVADKAIEILTINNNKPYEQPI